MQVSSYLKNARRSMRHKLIGYMIVLAVLLVAALLRDSPCLAG